MTDINELIKSELRLDLSKEVKQSSDPLEVELDSLIKKGSKEISFSEMSPELLNKIKESNEKTLLIYVPGIGLETIKVGSDKLILKWL